MSSSVKFVLKAKEGKVGEVNRTLMQAKELKYERLKIRERGLACYV